LFFGCRLAGFRARRQHEFNPSGREKTMNVMQSLLYYIDQFLIFFYRLADVPIVGYIIGTFVLAMISVMIGQFTYAVAYRWNRKWLNSDSREMIRMHNLSIRALAAKDKSAYKACNKVANDAFGKHFFAQMAMGMASLWPAPFALAWMETRFADVAFLLPFRIPYVGETVGYTATFIPMFVLAHILFGKVKYRLPFFSQMRAEMVSDAKASEPMMTLEDISAPRAGEPRAALHEK
jgi:hypothetical protein